MTIYEIPDTLHGYKNNDFKAVVRPKEIMVLGCGNLLPDCEYTITKQQEPINNPEGLKRSFILGWRFAGWVALPIEEHFDIVELL